MRPILPFEVTLFMIAQDLLTFQEHDLFSTLKSEVVILAKVSQGVNPVNCQIGAEAAKALTKFPDFKIAFTKNGTD